MVYQFDFQRQSPNTGFAFFLLYKNQCYRSAGISAFLIWVPRNPHYFHDFRQPARKILIVFITFVGLAGKSQLTKPGTALKIGRKRRRFPFLRKDTVFFADRNANAGETAKPFGRQK